MKEQAADSKSMETVQIQKIIASQFADPRSVLDLRKLLKEVAESAGANPDEKALAQMGANARQRVIDKFTQDAIVPLYESYYERFIT